ncbi:hydantoinase B/oxoprolinase family protein [Aurantiacibacter poecillastricola]|uniref:hydantoinase B/oxoprolinase family protein n=1 Tax=Aurantiacibacter poecillastricola TaxID=3064385 RepID=UPI00273DCE2E|nr:hydantoinase B/oxoprolinase family protein [Aurantiacibacter sp. 219JJ12-13]MDP5260115.1 hydantoinase B/oxoprolinase family protein [Aurantiacibacter sp. 219JJ12-13]
MTGSYRFAIDRGGTFTDVVAETPAGEIVTAKLLSSNPEQYPDAASEAVRRLLAEHGEGPIAELRIGTTIATNALLEREGERVALAITAGHADALRIGNQARPDIFARHIVKPERLERRTIEISERVGADGTVLTPLDEEAARLDLQGLRDEGFEAIAIVLMHGWQYQEHEKRLAAIARELGFLQISASHEVSPLMKLVPRGDTSVADAYLSPVIRRYVDQLDQRLPEHGSLRFMQSNGGLADARAFRGKDAVLSGPAGGVVGMVETAQALGYERLIGFDMGGTSTDVCHYSGEYERTGDSVVAGIRIAAPMMQVHTVAAGGGSVCRFDGQSLKVGPQSAGADPGPACYRKGGPLTVTDCNLVLGRIDPDEFPHVFGPDGDQPLDPAASYARIEEIAAQLSPPMSLQALAEGFLSLAVDEMANAIRAISTARGHDVTTHALACFGGAGGQFACRVADELGIDTVLVHPLAGMLSAYGIGLAPVVSMREAGVVRPLAEDFSKALTELEHTVTDDLTAQGIAADRIDLIPRMRLRFEGSDTTLDLPLSDDADTHFREEHRRRFGWSDEDAPIVLEALSVEGRGSSGGLAGQSVVEKRGALSPGESLDGPAMIPDPGSTTIVEKGWRATLAEEGSLILTRTAPRDHATAAGTRVDPIRLAIFNNMFMAIAEEMGVVLESTASSVNIKERLDFSCALFDGDGSLIANAPHIPVHLGSMSASIRRIVENRAGSERGIRRGDAYCLNDPYAGGTHLPDVTVIVPVFLSEDSARPDAFVAARGHHADIGGTAPGSMPPDSTSIEEEGIRLDDVLLVEEGRFRREELLALLTAGDYPARNPSRNIADLKAQLAACARGSYLLADAAKEHTAEVLTAYMGHALDYGEAAVRSLVERLSPGSFSYAMDNGAEVCVSVSIDNEARTASFDFTGTSVQLPNNFNAPAAITRAAVLYCLRCLIDDDIPLNDGCLRPVTITVPEGSMLAPLPPAAVVAGNVETSQVVTDAIFAALRALAPSQGTMNNFTFGDDTRQYYETIAGGSGAGNGHDGTDAVQTNMTNSRLTDPEVLETRLPVRVERFAIREGSGGTGRWHGGEGVERVIRFLEPMRAQMLANRRKVPPRGIAGGGDALPGETRVERADGSVLDLGATGGADMQPSDAIVIRTPGGGGYGEA